MRESMRRLGVAVAIGGLALTLASGTRASVMPGMQPWYSPLALRIGSLDLLDIDARPESYGLFPLVCNGPGGGAYTLNLSSSIWSTVNHAVGTSLFTGVPTISNAVITVKNAAMSFESGFSYVNFVGGQSAGGPYFGGESGLSGRLVLWLLDSPVIEIDLAHVGGEAGGTTRASLGGIPLRLTAGPWVTGAAPITGVTTNLISIATANGARGPGVALTLHPTANAEILTLSTGGGFVSTNGGPPLEAHTVTLLGSSPPEDCCSYTRRPWGRMTLVAPMRIDTSPWIAGRLPGGAWMTVDLPEPGSLLLLVSGAAALAALGWRRRSR